MGADHGLLERSEQLRLLRDIQARAARGRGRVVLVGAPAGMGKTSLVRATADVLAPATRTWTGTCDPLSTPRPLGPFEDIGADVPQVQQLLRDAETHQLGPQLLHLLARSTLLAIEDTHWIDDASVDVLVHVARRIDQTHSVVLATYRPDEVGEGHPFSRFLTALASNAAVVQVELPPLSRRATATLAADAGVDADELHRRTGGNPFFVTEVLAHDDHRVPPTIAAAVRRRVGGLGTAGRSLVDAASIGAEGMELALLERLLGEDVAVTGLDDATAVGVVALDRTIVRFRHDLARRAVYEALATGRRLRLHRAVLDALEARPETSAARLAHHAVGAGDAAAILRHAPAAADEAEVRLAFREAARHLDHALEASTGRAPPTARAELLERLVNNRERFMPPQQLADRYGELAQAWREAGNGSRALRASAHQAFLLTMTPRHAESHEVLAELRAGLVDAPVDVATVEARARTILFGVGDTLAEIRDEAMAVVADADRVGANRALVDALMFTATFEIELGEIDVALARVDRAERLAREHYPQAIGHPDSICAGRLVHVGELALGRTYLERAWAAMDSRDHTVGVHYCLATMAGIELLEGAWDGALARATALREEAPDGGFTPFGTSHAARVRLRRGEHRQARVLLDACREPLLHGNPQMQLALVGLLAEAAEAGLTDPAEVDALTARRLADQAPDDPWSIELLHHHRALAGLPHDIPDPPRTPYGLRLGGRWREAADEWERRHHPWERAIALLDGDEAALRTAVDVLHGLGAEPMADRARARLRGLGATDIPMRARRNAADDELTRRQVEVLTLVAEGLTDAGIAERLYLSRKTVGHHVSAILSRLGARSRTEAVALAHERGLLA